MGGVVLVSHAMAIDYFTKDNVYIEWMELRNDHDRRLPLIKAVLEICLIIEDCSDIEKELIMSAVTRKKKMFRRGCDPDE